ncbi:MULTISPECIES: LysM peptidoglycan-binding domain-containing protein [unclassified Paenibacillus]|uniref:LysM peptidoglycan-binding domain-containing protein n=1 Tax=unclassified Paenibacillus TaxID=185978 RepID=UPI000953D48A|nr:MULTISPECIES: LysM peptidoglycan-binding domain-containing protein [unclassified Paenibacillus]ASS65271.1 LysM peptidoglycan-binding domain-containing protein [Paenibacillus sp. RUD330]SIQ41813.1 LysM domain-containing protein [Paenibacillus sp. RU4X]SIQ64016.1 LysM domain-containing protein [Paenibacillus sp. RU4T]
MMTLSGYSTPERGSEATVRRQEKKQEHIYLKECFRPGAGAGDSRFITRSSSVSARTAGSSRPRRMLPYAAAALLFLLAFSSFWGFSGASSSHITPAAEGELTITVTSGDTLWSIAGNSGLSNDIRRSVFMIKERNGLKDSDLQAGQTLIIPKQS